MYKYIYVLCFSSVLMLLASACLSRSAFDIDDLCKKKMPQERLLCYRNEEAKGNATADLYSNIGEVYVALKKPSYAIRYFEKGLALSPLNARMLAQRKIALKQCSAEVIANNSNFYERQLLFIKIIEGINITFIIILSVAWICYFLSIKSSYRIQIQKCCKMIVLWSILILVLVYGVNKNQQLQKNVILIHKTAIYNGPSCQAKLAFQWDECYQLKITNIYDKWIKVEAFNHQSGWVRREDLFYLP